MNLYLLLFALIGGLIYFFLKPTWKVWFAFFVMTSCFDLVPGVINNIDIWDVGIIMLLLIWPQLLFLKKTESYFSELYVKIIKLFVAWMAICFIWSIVVYGYPLILTIKASRQMLLGYLSFFVLLRLYESEKNSLKLFLKTLYAIIYVLLAVSIAQYFLKIKILFGHFSELGQETRFLPIFLPFAHLFMWQHIAKIVTGVKTGFSELLFILLALFVTLITFTRGIYFAVLLSGCLLVGILIWQRRLSLARVFLYSMLGLVGIVAIYTTGFLDKFVARASTGLSLIASESQASRKQLDDTFSGRIALTGERFHLVMEKNPLFGFGFVHEDLRDSLGLKLRYGSVVYTKEYLERYKHSNRYTLALHSADAGWPNIAIDTGLVGLFLFISILITLFIHYTKSQKTNFGDVDFLRLAFLIQVFSQIVLMFNGNTYVKMVQIPCFMLAGYTYCSRINEVHASDVLKERKKDDHLSLAQNQYHYPLVQPGPLH